MYQALDKLKASPKTLDYLFPTKSTKPSAAHQIYRIKLDTSSLYNSSIATNGEQLQAVHQILNGLSPHEPYIIIGPPGTGKTTTIAEAILQLYFQGDNRILVTAGSNSACDTIALRLCEIFSTHHKLSEMREQCNLKWTMELKHRYMDAHKLKGVLNKKWVESLKTLRLFALSFNMSSVDPKLKEHFVCQTSAQTRALGSFKLIVATLCTVGRMVVSGCGHFSHVFIDEAAASSEPEALMGIMGTRGDDGHIILSGDHKQLSAVIKSERAAALGLEQSLMERLMLCEAYAVDEKGNYDHALQARLRRNYRSHPAIVGIYNKLYYNNELIALAPLGQVSQAANWKVLPNREYPVLFHAVQGKTRREKNSTSSFNELEASLVYSYVMHLMRNGLGGGVMVKQEDIGVVTPYVAQCRLLSRSLSERGQRQVEVGSVEKYQGREKLIIIASLVSSFTSARFITNPKRMNVFLSRAKSLLIMIGNPLTLSQNADFKFIIEQCKLKGNYVTGNEVQ
ncbi:maker103 [Drosophila busckii]|uniref:Maker103 n=1 Tax=Drosophila busckii TaxID=30019 RepID=A0A0M3QVD3_DROBS|nr:maker103 [Drosophila busckii]